MEVLAVSGKTNVLVHSGCRLHSPTLPLDSRLLHRFFIFLSRCRQKIGAKRNDLATADLKKGLLDWLPSSPVVVNEPGQGSTEN
jgi:hypothetical protein